MAVAISLYHGAGFMIIAIYVEFILPVIDYVNQRIHYISCLFCIYVSVRTLALCKRES